MVQCTINVKADCALHHNGPFGCSGSLQRASHFRLDTLPSGHDNVPNHQRTANGICTFQKLVESGGNVWIPLDVLDAQNGDEFVNSLQAQAQKVIELAYEPLD
jgi:hypothetical protein